MALIIVVLRPGPTLIARAPRLQLTLRANGTGANSTIDLTVQLLNDTAVDNTTGCTGGCAAALHDLQAAIPLVLPLLNKLLATKPVKLPSLGGILAAKLVFGTAYAEVALALSATKVPPSSFDTNPYPTHTLLLPDANALMAHISPQSRPAVFLAFKTSRRHLLHHWDRLPPCNLRCSVMCNEHWLVRR